MKNHRAILFISILILLSGVVLYSCLKDTPFEIKKLELKASSINIYLGDEVLFDVLVDNKPVTASIFIDDEKISGNGYVFEDVGTFEVIAKLEGYLDSEVIVITVVKKPGLNLFASSTSVTVGGNVTFSVTSGEETLEADIYIDNQKISGSTYIFNNTGTFKVVAKLDGYADSDELSVTVREPQYKTDIYVAGTEVSGASQIAKYWENGSSVSLTSGTIAYATSIYVYNDDVYVAGFEENSNGVNVAMYWKNGRQYPLTNGASDAEAHSIFVYNGDVYVAGFESAGLNNVAKYWKNGVAVEVGSRSNSSSAFSVFVSNGDVFVGGREEKGDYEVAKYWRNGVGVELTSGQSDANIYSIYVNNNDVYTVGREFVGSKDVAKFWKNRTSTTLSNSTGESTAYSVFFNDGDVYIAGNDGDRAVYWKNGVMNVLSGGNGANSIIVVDGDVYVAGYEFDGNVYIARYWKNGSIMSLSSGTDFAYAYSIFVTKTLVD